MNSSHKFNVTATVQWTVATKFDLSTIFSQSVHTVHCSWTYEFHFSVTFLLKIGPTVLFTHLKIILLQYFPVFSFSFQFSVVSKRTLSVFVLCNEVSSVVVSCLFKLFSSHQCTLCTVYGPTNFTFQQLFHYKWVPRYYSHI